MIGDDPANCLTMTNRRDLYPPIEPYRVGALRLDARHAMYWEQSGNPRGAPDAVAKTSFAARCAVPKVHPTCGVA
jgi:hypothetical protein